VRIVGIVDTEGLSGPTQFLRPVVPAWEGNSWSRQTYHQRTDPIHIWEYIPYLVHFDPADWFHNLRIHALLLFYFTHLYNRLVTAVTRARGMDLGVLGRGKRPAR
jgi:hypothetical protein